MPCGVTAASNMGRRHDSLSHQPTDVAICPAGRWLGHPAVDARSSIGAPLYWPQTVDGKQRGRRIQIRDHWRAVRGPARIRHHRCVAKIQRRRSRCCSRGRRRREHIPSVTGSDRPGRHRRARRRRQLSQSDHRQRLAGNGPRHGRFGPRRQTGARCRLRGAAIVGRAE
jgi:hypothetical protein